MPLRKIKRAKCESCGRVWSPRKPDAPKLKCPTCGKYKVKIFDEEMKEEVKDGSKCDNDDGSCSGRVSSPGISPPDLPDSGDRKDGEIDHLLAGEKDPSPEIPAAASSGSGSPELEEPITDPHAATDPDLPSSGLGGGLWAGLAVLIMGVVAAVWYVYRKRSLAEDLEEVITDHPGSIPAGCSSDDLYGRGRLAYRGRA